MYGRKEFGIMAIIGAAVLLTASPLAASESRHTGPRYSQQAMQQALRFVDELEVQGQRIMTEALQVALQIEPDQSLARFEESREYFVTVLQTLKAGDPATGLPAPEEPELIAKLHALQQVWDQLDETLVNVIRSRSASRTDIILLSEFDGILVDISRQVANAYQHQFARTNLASMAVTTVVQAEHQSFLVERMQTEILLISYGHDVEEQRRQLAESAKSFDETLEDLISGNPAARLMPPPRVEIRSQLRNVQRIWDEVAPAIEQITTGAAVDLASVTQIVHRMEPLYAEMEMAIDLYAPQIDIQRETLDPVEPEPEGPPNV